MEAQPDRETAGDGSAAAVADTSSETPVSDQPNVILGPAHREQLRYALSNDGLLEELRRFSDATGVHVRRPRPSPPPSRLISRSIWIGLSVWAVGFAAAFALSWRTNTNWDRGVFAKLVYGTGAGAHSWSYILLWLMYIWGRHNPSAFVAKLADVRPVVSMG